jgi:mannose-6-phosphate isomerase-like protein (cupin superfamily)
VRRLDATPPASLWALRVLPGKHTPVESHKAWDRRLVVVAGQGQLRSADGTVVATLRGGDSELLPAGTAYALAATGEDALELLAVDLPA